MSGLGDRRPEGVPVMDGVTVSLTTFNIFKHFGAQMAIRYVV